jgi:ketosteroid isomerase-like protein
MDDESRIRALVATWMSATRSGDVATVRSLMTDDVVFLVAGQPPFGKQKFAEAMQAPAGGNPMRRAGHTLSVLRKEDGEWRLARDANLLTPVEN